MRIRFVVSLLVLLCTALALQPVGGEAGGLSRPKITWTVAGGAECADRVVCFSVRPGDSASVDITFTPSQDVINPKLVLQTPNGSRVMRMDSTLLPAVLQANGAPQTATIVIDVPPNYQASSASGRLYVADKGSVLVPPLNIRVQILHPTPVELALTPVVVPTNNIRLLADRFNIRAMTIISGTNLTWTNKDVRQHSVKGSLCDPTAPFDPNSACTPDPSLLDNPPCNAPDPDTGRFLCIDSGPLDPQATFTLRLTLPDRRQILHYFMEDGLGNYNPTTGTGYLTLK